MIYIYEYLFENEEKSGTERLCGRMFFKNDFEIKCTDLEQGPRPTLEERIHTQNTAPADLSVLMHLDKLDFKGSYKNEHGQVKMVNLGIDTIPS